MTKTITGTGVSLKNRAKINASDFWKNEKIRQKQNADSELEKMQPFLTQQRKSKDDTKEYWEKMRAYLIDKYGFAGKYSDIPDFIKKIKDELDTQIYYDNNEVKEFKIHENSLEKINSTLPFLKPLNDLGQKVLGTDYNKIFETGVNTIDTVSGQKGMTKDEAEEARKNFAKANDEINNRRRNANVGAGLLDVFKPIKTDYNNTSKATIQKFGNKKIVSLEVIRSPIQKIVNTILNTVTFGKWSKVVKENYDQLFHLGLKVGFSKSKNIKEYIIIEKNETVNISQNLSNYQEGSESLPVYVNKQITLKELLNNTLNKIGKDKYFLYNAKNQNCQIFIKDVLSANGFLNKDLQNFILQDAKSIIEQMPSYVEKTMNVVTDLGAKINQVTGGNKNYNKLTKKELIQLLIQNKNI